MKPFTICWFGIAVLIVCLTGCAAWSYLGYRISPDYPVDRTETLDLPGLLAPVRIYLDEFGVPHVEAEHEQDLMLAVGFLHGRARFFQMDMMRRFARGRLSELVGEQEVLLGSSVEVDTSMRGWGFDRSARLEADTLDSELKPILTAYAQGVNAALERFEPIEYRLLRVRPEPWTIADTIAVGHTLAWGITHNWQQEVCRLLLALHGGHERAERILPPLPFPGDPCLKAETDPRPLPPSVVPELEDLFPERPWSAARVRTPLADRPVIFPPFGGASNGWVMGGGRSSSGMPLLAGDPHLPHMLPSSVFQQHLRCPDLNVIGATVPGIPYVIFGHNENVAWTITVAMADVLDLYIERPAPKHSNHVLGPSGPEPLEVEPVTLRIREGSKFRELTAPIRRTPRGPLLNDMYPDLLPEWAPLVSIHGIQKTVSGTMLSLRRANQAGSVRELHEAMIGVRSLIGAIAAADTQGDIALFASGTVPVREHHRGTFPVPGWIGEYRWKRHASPREIPHAFGDGRDFFVNANNLLIDPTRSPVLFHVDTAPSYRRHRVVELIEATAIHTVESNARIQGDTLLLRAGRVIPALLEDLQGETPLQRRALELLMKWNHRAEIDSSACAIFFSIYREAILGALRDEVDEDGLKFLMTFRYFTNGVDLWFDDPLHPVWDDRSTGERETRAEIVRSAFVRALRELQEELGTGDPSAWRWGDLHTVKPQHPFGSKLDSFNLPSLPAPGACASVWKAHFDMGRSEHPYRCIYGPVLRMIVDLADIEHASWIVDTGNSGWPRSPHYGDQYEMWYQTKLAPMVSNWREIKRDASAVLTLQ